MSGIEEREIRGSAVMRKVVVKTDLVDYWCGE